MSRFPSWPIATALSLAACLVSGCDVASGMPAQTLMSAAGPPAYYVGKVKLYVPNIIYTARKIDYALEGKSTPVAVTNMPSKVPYARIDFDGRELKDGYVYLKIETVPAALDNALHASIPQMVEDVLHQPTKYAAAVLARLRTGLRGIAAAERDLVLTRFDSWVHAAIASYPKLDDADAPPVFPPLPQQPPAQQQQQQMAGAPAKAFAELVQLLHQDDPSLADRIHAIELALTSFPDLEELFALLKYPFVICRRTVGGAIGTEIVTYVEDHSENKCTVYYFYVHSDKDWPIDVVGFEKFGMSGITFERSVPKHNFIKLPMNRDASDKPWFIDAAEVESGPIVSMPTDVQKAFDDGVRRAHAIACGHIDPEDPIKFGVTALDLECSGK